MNLPTGAIVVLGIVGMLCITFIVVMGMATVMVIAICAAIVVMGLRK